MFQITMAHLVCMFCQVAVVYAQQGWKQAANGLNVLLTWLIAADALVALEIIVLPLFTIVPKARRRVAFGLRLCVVFFVVMSNAMELAMIVWSAPWDFNKYNQAGIVVWIMLGMLAALVHWGTHVATSHLVAVIQRARAMGSPLNASSVERTMIKQRDLKRGTLVICPPVYISCFGIAVVHGALGSFPFFWALVMTQWALLFPLNLSILVYIYGKRAKANLDVVGERLDLDSSIVASTFKTSRGSVKNSTA